LNHVFYADGNAEKISWAIKTNESVVEQNRIHVEMYRGKITDIQSKYVAMHVGLFWGIGVFKIRNEDAIKIMIDEKIIHDQLTKDTKVDDDLIVKKIHFIKQLIAQRKLKVEFEMIDKKDNLTKIKKIQTD